MTNREILQHIDDGANYYVSLFAEAIHMEKVDKEFYSCIKPKVGEQGISFIYHVHLNDLPPEQIKEVVDEMKSMNVPIWLGLLASDEVSFIFSGKEPTQGQNEPVENDEVYMAMLPEDQKNVMKKTTKL